MKTSDSFQVFPAIDLKDGRCVRLRQGRAEDATVYSEDPVAMAKHWVSEGAEWLHIVDLSGAFEGRPMHQKVIAEIAAAVNVPVQVGGGIRTSLDIEVMLKAGVRRVILGTRAYSAPGELASMIQRYRAAIVAGIDARDGFVQIKGWVETTQVEAVEFAARIAGMGVKTIIFTNISSDGMLAGPDVKAVGAICDAAACDVIAAGGVSSPADIAALRKLERSNLTGAIVGKALYEGRATLSELNEAARRELPETDVA